MSCGQLCGVETDTTCSEEHLGELKQFDRARPRLGQRHIRAAVFTQDHLEVANLGLAQAGAETG